MYVSLLAINCTFLRLSEIFGTIKWSTPRLTIESVVRCHHVNTLRTTDAKMNFVPRNSDPLAKTNLNVLTLLHWQQSLHLFSLCEHRVFVEYGTRPSNWILSQVCTYPLYRREAAQIQSPPARLRHRCIHSNTHKSFHID